MSPARSRLRQALLGLLVAAVLLGLAELSARLLTGAPDPLRVTGGLVDRAFAFERVSTEAGDALLPRWRDAQDHLAGQRVACRPEAPQVLVLGGSSVRGGSPGVGPPSEWAALAGQRAGLDTVNLGAHGLETSDLRQILESFGDCRADAVVLYAGHNDLGNLRFRDRYGTVGQGLTARLQAALSHSRLYELLSEGLAPGRARLRAKELDRPNVEAERVAGALERFADNLEAMAALSEEHDRQLLLIGATGSLLMPPADPHCDEERCAREAFEAAMGARGRASPEEIRALLQAARDQDYGALRANRHSHAHMRRLAAEAPHVHYLDAEALLPQDPQLGVPGPWLFADPIHFSVRGHEAMGELVGARLDELVGGT